MSTGKQSLTFGIELELYLIFHQSLLLSILPPNAQIVKDLPLTKAQALGQKWGILGPPRPLFGSSTTMPSRRTRIEECKAYTSEPLWIGQKILSKVRPGINVYEDLKLAHTNADNGEWHITVDPSLTGLGEEEMIRELGPLMTRNGGMNDWDHHGLEIPSRILTLTSPTWPHEIGQILTALKPTPSPSQRPTDHTALVTSHCGMHVHIGAGPTPSSFPLLTLKHLAYTLIVYEVEIGRLHHPCRREGSHASNEQINSNRDTWFLEGGNDNDDDDSGGGKKRGLQAQQTWQPLSDIHHDIFHCESVAGLVRLLCPNGKAHVVNLTYLTRPTRLPRTIEFRQHRGCLDPVSVGWWVRFVGGLVLLAQRCADRVEGESAEWVERVMGVRSWDDEVSFWDLLEAMRFEEEGKAFFKRKVAFYADLPGSKRGRVDESDGSGKRRRAS
ncbi:MAG: hypothetical protein M1827_007038 [Pycnora praestabilis]|nr:MAG: hypothetical protein M1827_007038 [Pycnora praestabilis]